MSKERIGNWIETYTGSLFYPLDPRDDEIDIRDIAHSLSLQCRFNGHCSEFYSVAQHSLLVVKHLESQDLTLSTTGKDKKKQRFFSANVKCSDIDVLLLRALLHDAAEAYICDVPRPLKIMLSAVQEADKLNTHAIYKKYNCTIDYILKWFHYNFDNLGDLEISEMIKQADNAILAAEVRDLGLQKHEKWCDFEPSPVAVIPMSPKQAEQAFLDKFYELQDSDK